MDILNHLPASKRKYDTTKILNNHLSAVVSQNHHLPGRGGIHTLLGRDNVTTSRNRTRCRHLIKHGEHPVKALSTQSPFLGMNLRHTLTRPDATEPITGNTYTLRERVLSISESSGTIPQ